MERSVTGTLQRIELLVKTAVENRFVFIAVLLMMLPYATVGAQTPHVHLESGSAHAQTIEAMSNARKILLQFRSIVVKVDSASGKSFEFTVQMLYDPRSRLFAWTYFQKSSDYDVEGEAKEFIKESMVNVAGDRLVVFRRPVFFRQVAVWEGSELYDSMEQGQAGVIRFFEEHRATAETAWNARSKSIDLMQQIPRDFMEQCYSDISIAPTIDEVRRDGKEWIFKITGANGNSAEIHLDDGFKVVSTKLIPRPGVIVLDSARLPKAVRAIRDGIPVELEAEELRVNIAQGCSLASVQTVLTIYDPASKLFMWVPGQPRYVAAGASRLPDELPAWFFPYSIFVIADDKMVSFSANTEIVRQSSSRFASIQEAQEALFAEVGKRHYVADDGKPFPLNSALFSMEQCNPRCDLPSWRGATHGSGKWRLQMEWSAGPLKDATVTLDDSYKLWSADLTYANRPAERSRAASAPLLMDALHKMNVDHLAGPPQIKFSMTDKSSSIHGIKNGQPVKVEAFLVNVEHAGKMLAVYEPMSRLFWCIYEAAAAWDNIGYYASQFEKGNSWLLITDERIISFDAMSSNNYIGVQESTMKYASFSDGLNHALTAIWQSGGAIRDGHLTFEIPLPRAFESEKVAPYRVAPRYLGISQLHDDWQLVFEGSSGQQGVVILSEKYETLRASLTFAGGEQK